MEGPLAARSAISGASVLLLEAGNDQGENIAATTYGFIMPRARIQLSPVTFVFVITKTIFKRKGIPKPPIVRRQKISTQA